MNNLHARSSRLTQAIVARYSLSKSDRILTMWNVVAVFIWVGAKALKKWRASSLPETIGETTMLASVMLATSIKVAAPMRDTSVVRNVRTANFLIHRVISVMLLVCILRGCTRSRILGYQWSASVGARATRANTCQQKMQEEYSSVRILSCMAYHCSRYTAPVYRPHSAWAQTLLFIIVTCEFHAFCESQIWTACVYCALDAKCQRRSCRNKPHIAFYRCLLLRAATRALRAITITSITSRVFLVRCTWFRYKHSCLTRLRTVSEDTCNRMSLNPRWQHFRGKYLHQRKSELKPTIKRSKTLWLAWWHQIGRSLETLCTQQLDKHLYKISAVMMQ